MTDRGARKEDLARTADAVRVCTRCRLHKGRTRAVPGEGPVGASLFLIGEAPGRSEDATGRPFVGSAGKVLTEALTAARIRRESVFITNVVKCRPAGNRAPREDEAAACRPYLLGQIAAVRPKVIVTLGATALRAIAGPRAELRIARGGVLLMGRVPVIPTYHPAAVLYNRELGSDLRSDFRTARGHAHRRKSLRSDPPRPGRPTETVRASGAVVVGPRRRVLLLRRTDEGFWCLPKGKMERGETARDTAVREVREETGLRVKLLNPIAQVRYTYYWPPRRVNFDKRISYFLALPTGGRLRLEAGFDKAWWASRGEAMTLVAWPNDKEVVAKAYEAIRSRPLSAGRRGPSPGAKRSGRPRA
ncbi:MAG: NUDIX domain-containing protein [Methanobacteriota archaeon]|nr:MAG: NUDIX domain-containing protein [Euryarchaeota archaeon]